MKDRFDQRQDQALYRGLHLSQEESDWVKHYLRVADHALFGQRPAPRVVVVDEDWHNRSEELGSGRRKWREHCRIAELPNCRIETQKAPSVPATQV